MCHPYLWLDAQYEKVRYGGRIVNAAILVAITASECGTAFLRSLVVRGLTGVRLVTSDAHLGIQAAVWLDPRRLWCRERLRIRDPPGPRIRN